MTTDRITIRLTGEQIGVFAKAWRGEFCADLESAPNPWWRDDEKKHPTFDEIQEEVGDYVDLLQRRVDVLGILEEGGASGDVQFNVSREHLDQVITGMLDPGSIGPMSREEFETARIAFAIEDQVKAAAV